MQENFPMRLRIMKGNKDQIFILHYSNIKIKKLRHSKLFEVNYYK